MNKYTERICVHRYSHRGIPYIISLVGFCEGQELDKCDEQTTKNSNYLWACLEPIPEMKEFWSDFPTPLMYEDTMRYTKHRLNGRINAMHELAIKTINEVLDGKYDFVPSEEIRKYQEDKQ